MATNASTASDSQPEGTETDPQDSTQDQGQTTDETSGQEDQDQQPQQDADASKSDDKGKKADDKSADKPDPAKQALLADLNKARNETRAAKGRITTLEQELADRPKQEVVDAIQAKYDRLEAFVQAAGGTLGKALDSRSFTKALFETDEDVADIVQRWSQANPTATHSALSSTASQQAPGKANMNDLLRAALK